MDIDRLQSLALEIRDLYRESNEREEKATWDARAYADGLLVDVAALICGMVQFPENNSHTN